MTDNRELYQQVILEHNRKPRNFGKIETYTHRSHGDNPLCGDAYDVYLSINTDGLIEEINFDGHGCAISKASASMMTASLKGKTVEEAEGLFEEFHQLIMKKMDPNKDTHKLGKLTVFSGIWQYPARVKCATLSWHTMKGALNHTSEITTEV